MLEPTGDKNPFTSPFFHWVSSSQSLLPVAVNHLFCQFLYSSVSGPLISFLVSERAYSKASKASSLTPSTAENSSYNQSTKPPSSVKYLCIIAVAVTGLCSLRTEP